jgi:hypothetical protein
VRSGCALHSHDAAVPSPCAQILFYVLSGGGIAYGLLVRAPLSACAVLQVAGTETAMQGSWICLVYFFAIIGMETWGGQLTKQNPE